MKRNKLSTAMALSISLELILSPLPAMAQNSNGDKIMSGITQGLNLGMDMYNTVRGGPQQGGGQMSPQMATDMAALQKQQTPANDKYFTYDNLSKIPGLMEYLTVKNMGAGATGGKMINPAQLNCQTLPTTLHEANNEVCRNRQINGLAGNPVAQRDEAFAYYNQYLQIDKLYQNYSQDSNVGGQSYGTGCMNDAMTILKGFFAYRAEQLDTVLANMEAATAKFEELSESDLKAIRESTAALNGENSKFATEFKNTDVFNYGKRFGDPACNSIFSKDGKDGVAQLGKTGGLISIEKKLKDDFSAVPAGSKYSPEQFISKSADIDADIRKMADKVAEQANLNFSQIASGQEGYSSFLNSVGTDVPSETGANAALNKSFFSDLQTKFTKTRNLLSDESTLISSELGGRGKGAFDLISKIDNDSSFDAEVATLENDIKADCVKQSGIDTALSRVYDPNLSKEANKQSSGLIKKKLKAILEDTSLSAEKRRDRLKELEGQTGSRYEMKLDANYETQEVGADGKLNKKIVNAGKKVTFGEYFSDVITNCDSQFQVNKLNNKLSGKEAIKRLRTLKEDFKKAARQHSQDIKNEIVKKMINCDGNGAKAASSGVATCSPAKLDMTSPGFCSKGAASCSANMKSCTEKAQKFVTEIKEDRLKRTTTYNNQVELNRKQVVGMFDNALVKYQREAESLRGMFGVGFTMPTGIQRDIKDGSQFKAEYQADGDDKLEIKDPKAYLEMAKTNMKSLQAEVKKQQEAIIGDGGALKKHIDQTKTNYQKNILSKASKLAADCLAAYDSYAKMIADQKTAYDKGQGELGEKNSDLCSKYDQIMSNNPNGACDTFEQTGSDALKAAAKAGGNSADISNMIDNMRARCAGAGKDLKDAGEICSRDIPNFTTAFNDKYSGRKVPDTYSSNKLAFACNIDKAEDKDKEGWCKKTEGTTTSKTVTIKKETEAEALKGAEDEAVESTSQTQTCSIPNKVSSGKVTEPSKSFDFKMKCEIKATYDCSAVKDEIKYTYSAALDSGKLNDSSQANPTPATCMGSNNSGPYNTKSGLPAGTNPVQQQNGATGTTW